MLDSGRHGNQPLSDPQQHGHWKKEQKDTDIRRDPEGLKVLSVAYSVPGTWTGGLVCWSPSRRLWTKGRTVCSRTLLRSPLTDRPLEGGSGGGRAKRGELSLKIYPRIPSPIGSCHMLTRAAAVSLQRGSRALKQWVVGGSTIQCH